MTGRELVLYILENRLEDKEVFKDGAFMNFMSVEEAACVLGVGHSTILTMIRLNKMSHVKIGDEYYVPTIRKGIKI